MITLTPQALRLIAAYRERGSKFEWCLLISWLPGEVDTFRLASGEQGLTRGIPKGWTVSLQPDIAVAEMDQRYTLSVVSGVKVFVDNKSPPGFPFRGGVVDANGIDLYLAP
jgi:hypothetical protein